MNKKYLILFFLTLSSPSFASLEPADKKKSVVNIQHHCGNCDLNGMFSHPTVPSARPASEDKDLPKSAAPTVD